VYPAALASLSSWRAVVRIVGHIIGTDGDDGSAFALVIAPKLREFAAHVLDEWAVVADEHDKQRRFGFEIAERNHFAVGIGQLESRAAVPSDVIVEGVCAMEVTSDLRFAINRGGEFSA